MTILGSIPLFRTFFSTTSSEKDCLRKSIQPLSNALKQRNQPYSQTNGRASAAARAANELITEANIMNTYPRPSLQPTLHYTLFGLSNSPPDDNNSSQRRQTTVCSNCSGPHSSMYCPC
ncbi:unnamed protein product [Cunninghamella echinulata]